MDGKVIYRDQNGEKKEINTGRTVPGEQLRAEDIEIDEEGQWVLVHTSDSSGNEGSIMIPREKVDVIYEGRM